MKKSVKNFRLPSIVFPIEYSLCLTPDLDKFIFDGSEKIKVSLKKSTKEIKLHSKEMKIKSAKFISKAKEIKANKINSDKELEAVTLSFSELLPKGEGEILIDFEGILNDKMRGFYRSVYEVSGEKKYLATTQFEPTDARYAFPCFDEPAQKAIFNLTLIIPQNLTAISNTPIKKISQEKNKKRIEFLPTPKMSTYLLVFIVGEFEYLETKTKEGVLVKVYSIPGKKELTKFGLDVASKSLSFYNDYFDIPYPLPQLSLIAIPDFAAGAMENWGAVTFRETTLLVDPKLSSAANKQWVAMVIAHELAHMWFGDLVTMEWWTDLWLNEGFATYIENLAVDYIFPQWDIWTQFVFSDQGTALKLDSLKNTHPIEVEVKNPNEINEIFDKISYSKGASIIRMLADYLGKKDFRDGLRYYIKKYQYCNTKTNDLWDALEKISGKPVKNVMENWTKKAGYPLLKVEEKKEGLLLSQARFFSSPISKKANDKTIWSIPVSVKTSSKINNFLMTKKILKIKKPKGDWLKINSGESSYIRVSYPPNNLELISGAIKEKKLPVIDRLGIIRDAFDLSESSDFSTPDALAFAKNYEEENDYTVWATIASRLNELNLLLSEEKYYQNYRRYCLGIFSKISKKMGWNKKPGERHTDFLLRNLAIYNSGSYGDKATIKEAQNLFKKIITNKEDIDSDIRGIVYNLIAENGGEKELEIMIDLYKKEKLDQEKERIGRALTSFRDQKLIKKVLEFAISEHVRSQDTVRFVGGVFINPMGRRIALNFVLEKWGFFSERYGKGGLFMMSRLIEPMGVFTQEKDAEEIEDFFKKRPVPEAERTLAQVLEQIRSNDLWLKRDGKGLEILLKNC